MLKYASMLFFGDGISSNKEEATRYIMMTAENGNNLDFFGAPFYCFVDTAKNSNSGGNLRCIDCSGSVSGDTLQMTVFVSNRDHLIIVTDGCVGISSIDESDIKMKKNDINFDHVTTFVIGNGGNLSVGDPYSRRSSNIIHKVESIRLEFFYIEKSMSYSWYFLQKWKKVPSFYFLKNDKGQY